MQAVAGRSYEKKKEQSIIESNDTTVASEPRSLISILLSEGVCEGRQTLVCSASALINVRPVFGRPSVLFLACNT